MKKFIFLILSIIAIGYLAFFVGYEIYIIKPFININTETFKILTILIKFGPPIIIGLTLLTYFYGKGLKTLFFVLVVFFNYYWNNYSGISNTFSENNKVKE